MYMKMLITILSIIAKLCSLFYKGLIIMMHLYDGYNIFIKSHIIEVLKMWSLSQ